VLLCVAINSWMDGPPILISIAQAIIAGPGPRVDVHRATAAVDRGAAERYRDAGAGRPAVLSAGSLARLIVEDAAAAFVLHRRGHVVHQPGVENLQLYPLAPAVML
jgi:hypothetical protein